MHSADSRPVFTVFTPSFNRAHTLHRVYESLCAQTFRDFEWLVVDDGSTDGTCELVSQWQPAAPFVIQYVRKENGGKHTAWNRGVVEARGSLFLPLDSDDACSRDALEVLLGAWMSIPADQRAGFTGVTCLVADEAGRVVGTPFPKDVTDSDSVEIQRRYRVTGEKWGFHRTDVLRTFRFPEPPGEKFVPESVLWFRIARFYRTRFINRVLRTYYQSAKDKSRLSFVPIWKSAKGRSLAYLTAIDDCEYSFWWDPIFFLGSAAYFSRTSWHAGVGVADQWRSMKTAAAKLMWLMMLPVGLSLMVRDRICGWRTPEAEPVEDSRQQ